MNVERKNSVDTTLKAQTFSSLEQIRLCADYFRVAVQNGGLGSITPWISIETSKQFFSLMDGIDFAHFPKMPFLGNVVVVNSSAASRSFLQYDLTHLAPDTLQKRMFDLTRGDFILSASDREEWRQERRMANPVFNPKSLEKDTPRLQTIIRHAVAQFQEADGNEPLSTKTRAMIASLMMGAYMGHPLSTEDALRMVKSYERFSKLGTLAVLGGTDIPVLRRFFIKLLGDFHGTVAAHVSHHMPGSDEKGNTPFQEHLLAGLSRKDMPKILDRVRGLMAGMNSVTTATQLLLYMLGSDQGLQQEIREAVAVGESDRIDAFLEEMATRYVVPITSVRSVTKDFDLAGMEFTKGMVVVLPHVFWEPDEKQQKRDMPHFDMQFGTGPRVCIGKHFSKLILENVVQEFIRNTENIRALNHPELVLNPLAPRPSEPFQVEFEWRNRI